MRCEINVTDLLFLEFLHSGCGASCTGIQNPLNFFKKVTCSKGFFDICSTGGPRLVQFHLVQSPV